MNNLNLDLSKFKMYYEDNQKTVRMVALILIVGLSILFFWIRGDTGNVELNVSGDDGTDILDESDLSEDMYNDDPEEEGAVSSSKPGIAYVDISGEVKLPGVYKVTSETRLFEVIDMAGGLTDDADSSSLNRAERVQDGQKVVVRAFGESEEGGTDGEAGISGNSESALDDSGKVNINIADLSTLQTIAGIGPSKAQSIIDYREQNGYFTTIEEIMYVSGIGEKTFASIKDQIVV